MAKSGINKVILVGNLGQDPEVKYTAGGAAVTTLSIATSDSWKDRDTGEDQERTEWHRVVLWRRLAEIAGEYLKNGSKVYVEGQLQTRKWEQAGQTRYTTEIIARDIQFLDSKGTSSNTPSPENSDTSSDIICTNRNNSRFKDIDEARCLQDSGKPLYPVRGNYKDSCSLGQTCRSSNICNITGFKLNDENIDRQCVGRYCSEDVNSNDFKECCEEKEGYVECEEGEEGCINGYKCDVGRILRLINDIEECKADNTRRFEECEGQEYNCRNGIRCMAGFIKNDSNIKRAVKML